MLLLVYQRQGLQLFKNNERIVKTHTDWRKHRQIKKIKTVMTVIIIVLCFSVVAGAVTVWMQLKPYWQKQAQDSTPVSSQAVGNRNELPVYGNTFNLMLVNSTNKLTDGYMPELESFDGVEVDSRILPALKKMFDDAETAGNPLVLKAGYVDAEKQNELFKAYTENIMKSQKLSEVKAESIAQSAVGKGGYNENQTGLAVTISASNIKNGSSFASTDQYNWLIKNCIKYGFILRYPEDKTTFTGMEYDPCHFRYVGTDNAVQMRKYSMCLEEYVSYIRDQS